MAEEDTCHILVQPGYFSERAYETFNFFSVCQIGITDPVHQQKLLSAVQQMLLDKGDLETVNQLRAAGSGYGTTS